MSLWRRTRNEVAGAWRSLRYDMGRRPAPEAVAPVPDVTSTGMSTFGGAPVAEPRTGHPAYARPPRRPAAVAAFGVLAVVGAAGSYFAVVNGLGTLLGGKPAAAEPYPLAVAAPTTQPADPADVADSTSGMGLGSAQRAAAATTVAVPQRTLAVPTTEPGAAPPAPRRTRLAQAGTPANDDCDCLTPPVPTPTAPPPPSPTPSDDPPVEPTSSETPGESPSAEPSRSRDKAPAPPARPTRHRY
jgi:hypothetical protein